MANEVQKLSEQSNQATEQIADLIKEVQSETKETELSIEGSLNKLISQISTIKTGGKAVDKIVEEAAKTSDAINELKQILISVTDNSNTVMSSIEEISSISEQSSASFQEVAATSEQQSAIVRQMAQYINELNETSKFLSKEIQRFKV